jgi:hypothetical protein
VQRPGPEGTDDAGTAPPDALTALLRWEESGGRWRVVARTRSEAVIALLTCDAGEEVDRLTSSAPELLAHLGDRVADDG